MLYIRITDRPETGKLLVASPVCDVDRVYAIDAKHVRAFDLSPLGGGSDPMLWSTSVPGEKGSTPVVVDGLMFLVAENGMALCLDAESGEILWKTRLKGRYFSSVIATGDRVLFNNEIGQTSVVAIDREFRLLATNLLKGSIYASIAPVEHQLFVRTTEYLYSISETAK